jgi:hypothetical protein
MWKLIYRPNDVRVSGDAREHTLPGVELSVRRKILAQLAR